MEKTETDFLFFLQRTKREERKKKKEKRKREKLKKQLQIALNFKKTKT